MNIYCIFNQLENSYQSVFNSETDLKARITFSRVSEKSPDYQFMELCKIAEFDEKTGMVKATTAPVRLDKYIVASQVPIDDINKEIEKK